MYLSTLCTTEIPHLKNQAHASVELILEEEKSLWPKCSLHLKFAQKLKWGNCIKTCVKDQHKQFAICCYSGNNDSGANSQGQQRLIIIWGPGAGHWIPATLEISLTYGQGNEVKKGELNVLF